MDTEVRKALEKKLDNLLAAWVKPYMQSAEDRAEIKLLTDVLTLNRLDRLVYHLENGQIAIIVP